MISRKRKKIEVILVNQWVSKGDFYNFPLAWRFIVYIFSAAAARLRRAELQSYFQVL